MWKILEFQRPITGQNVQKLNIFAILASFLWGNLNGDAGILVEQGFCQ